MMLWPQICCTQYNLGKCLHPAAPRKISFFSSERTPYCIQAIPFDPKDARVGTITECKIKIPIPKPPYPTMPSGL